MAQVMSDLQAATDQIPESEHATGGEEPLRGAATESRADGEAGRVGWERFCPKSWPNWG